MIPSEGQLRVEPALLDQAFSRAAGTPRIEGNSVRLLCDAGENYPAWLDAIAAAQRYVHFESYIIRDDKVGRQFAEALMAKSREGVSIRLLYDWMGALGKTPARYWADLRRAGVEVRCFNPLRFLSPFGWVHRDHRKSLIVDGRVAFITGLCVGDAWVGDSSHGVPPWRDTGVEVGGPAVSAIAEAFAQVWSVPGPPLPAAERPLDHVDPTGDVSMRIVASQPDRAGLLRLDQLVAAAARETLWVSDAYFVGIPSYVQALRAAALDGVDVRLLVPGGTDIPVLRPMSQAGFGPLLQAGIRVFEWNGPMMHAKTAVADGRWARVGSSNLNVASWVGNYELDAVVEDAGFARSMMEQYLKDLGNATEVLLPREQRRHFGRRRPERQRSRVADHLRQSRGAAGSAGRVVAGAVRLGNTVSVAVTDHRVLQPADARIIGAIGLGLLLIAVAVVRWPLLLAVPAALLLVWIAVVLLVRAHRQYRRRQPEAMSLPDVPQPVAAAASLRRSQPNPSADSARR